VIVVDSASRASGTKASAYRQINNAKTVGKNMLPMMNQISGCDSESISPAVDWNMNGRIDDAF